MSDGQQGLFEVRDGEVIVPAGRYLIGDLCYSVGGDDKPWDDFLEAKLEVDANSSRGILMGRPAASFDTACGDGEFTDGDGRDYPVDSATIGIMAWPEGDAPRRMHVAEFDVEQVCYVSEGRIILGDIAIETDPLYRDDREQLPEEDNDTPSTLKW